MWRSALFCSKPSDLSKFMVCPRGQAGVEPVQTKGEGSQFFAILCERIFWTAPYCKRNVVKTVFFIGIIMFRAGFNLLESARDIASQREDLF